ncbi:MAG: hypothetical protein FWF69_04905 [Firmicutes bacterium]|nr:hypothetical protein [Bacillota bacterium]
MRGRLAVSDSYQGLLAVLTLPDLEISAQKRMPFRPGKLASGLSLYCADVSEPAIYRVNKATLEVEQAFSSAPEIEALLLSEGDVSLYALAGGADSLQAFGTEQGRLLGLVRVGLHPRALAQDIGGEQLAVACGGTCNIALLSRESLSVLATFQAGGVTVDICFFAGQLMALCAAGEYDMGTVVGAITSVGKWTPWVRLPGLPGAITPCGGGLLVGHMNRLTMLDPPNGRIRWQTTVAGLPTTIVPIGRAACFADSLDGLVGLIDLRRGTVLRRLRVKEPAGLTALEA